MAVLVAAAARRHRLRLPVVLAARVILHQLHQAKEIAAAAGLLEVPQVVVVAGQVQLVPPP
jgi:hypothetical protein